MMASEQIALEIDLLDPTIAQQLTTALAADADAALPAPLAARLGREAERACLPPQMLGMMSPPWRGIPVW